MVGPSALGLHLTGDVTHVIQVWINNSSSNHCISHFKAQLTQFLLIQHLMCTYWIKGILCGYAIRSGRGRPAVGPAAADFPQDVCLTVSRNHKVFLLYIVASVLTIPGSWNAKNNPVRSMKQAYKIQLLSNVRKTRWTTTVFHNFSISRNVCIPWYFVHSLNWISQKPSFSTYSQHGSSVFHNYRKYQHHRIPK